jgi:hypothetical protein
MWLIFCKGYGIFTRTLYYNEHDMGFRLKLVHVHQFKFNQI